MTEDKNQQGSPKGFAGFQEHVSDVDSMLQKPEIRPTSQSQENYPSDCVLSDPKSASSDGIARPHTPGRRIDKKMLSIVIVIGFVVAVGLFGNQKKEEAPAPALPTSYEYTTPQVPADTQEAQSYQPPTPQPYQPATSQESYAEEIPPIGTGLLLNRAQITYCRAEKIRIEAMKLAVDNYDAGQVDTFNTRVHDYNNRCGDFRYKKGVLESVEATVEANRFQLEEEGRNLLR